MPKTSAKTTKPAAKKAPAKAKTVKKEAVASEKKAKKAPAVADKPEVEKETTAKVLKADELG